MRDYVNGVRFLHQAVFRRRAVLVSGFGHVSIKETCTLYIPNPTPHINNRANYAAVYK